MAADPLEEFMDRLFDELSDGAMGADHLCACGTYEEAYSTALKVVEDMIEHDCPSWAIQVCVAFSVILSYMVSTIQLEEPGGKFGQLSANYIAGKLLDTQGKKGINERLSTLIRNLATTAKEKGVPDKGLTNKLPELEAYLAKR